MKTYARIDSETVVEIIPPWTNEEGIQVDIPIENRFTPEFVSTLVDITSVIPAPIVGWSYVGGIFSEPIQPPIDLTQLAAAARYQRDLSLRNIYDPGINMALRALRMSADPEKIAYAQSKVSELDNFAELLLSIPDQAGFPQAIDWPEAPTK